MVFVLEEVRCAVCKSIFCCLECRNRHELNAHNANEVWAERNRMRCDFCQGYSTMEFQSRNDFALIMHLCQTHLPLHCKKCLTEFKSIKDFSAGNKCAHMNDLCNLESVSCDKTQSIDAIGKALVGQTSTPMYHNLVGINSPDLKEQSCSSCLTDKSPMPSQPQPLGCKKCLTVFKSIGDFPTGIKCAHMNLCSLESVSCDKTQSIDAIGKALVGQTSTPMYYNLVEINSPDLKEQSSSSCLADKSPMPPQSMSSIVNSEKLNGADVPDIWFTPKEYVQSKVIENIEIYTPIVSKKRSNVRRFEEKECSSQYEHQSKEVSKIEPSQGSGNKIWSFVSTFFRFASLTPSNDLTMPVLNGINAEPHMIIKRCASFTGILRETNSPTQSEDDNELDPLHPIKRRRITSMDKSQENTEVNYKKRIMCRPAIRRMRNN